MLGCKERAFLTSSLSLLLSPALYRCFRWWQHSAWFPGSWSWSGRARIQTLGFSSGQHSCSLTTRASGFLSSPLSQSQEHGRGRTGAAAEGTQGGPGSHQVVQLRVGREQWPLRADLGGRGEARQGVPPPAHPSCCLPGARSGAAHLLSKGSDVLIEGIGGADITAWGCAQPSRGPISGRACGQLTLLKDQGQEREEGVPGGTGSGHSWGKCGVLRDRHRREADPWRHRTPWAPCPVHSPIDVILLSL